LLEETVGVIDVAAVNARLEGKNTPESEAATAPGSGDATGSASADAPKPNANLSPRLPRGSEESEAELDLDEQSIRDLQARLFVLGHDPNGVDGVIGRGTRAALSAWQVSQGAEPTGYLSSEQYGRLRVMSESALSAWRANPENERRYLPPPPMELGPGNISGDWRFTTRCGPSSSIGQMTITGILNVEHAGGNRYSGRVQQSQGLRGQFSGSLDGRRLMAEINWGWRGRIQIVGTVEDQRLAMSGRDSNGCSFFSVKS
jgi:peptidoglycan hydrolase-like protein with peptidoglycan-binding domain